LYFLVHAGIYSGERQLQLAHAHRLVQVPGLWRFANTYADTYTVRNTDADADSYADANTYTDSNTDANSATRGAQ
jgi:hypothetical protein